MTKEAKDKDVENATRLLKGAYSIETPQDSVKYYREFASLYDEQYAGQLGYIYPSMLADVYSASALVTDIPILDIGCGTGLVAQSLIDKGLNSQKIDGLDISAEMLQSAAKKKLYRNLFEADLTRGTELTSTYGAIVSAGTFTFGHLGPEVLPELLSLGKTDTLYCIGVNSAFYEQQGFKSALDTMEAEQLITKPDAKVTEIYLQNKSNADRAHAKDTATVLVYRQK